MTRAGDTAPGERTPESRIVMWWCRNHGAQRRMVDGEFRPDCAEGCGPMLAVPYVRPSVVERAGGDEATGFSEEAGARALYEHEGKPLGEWRDGRRKGIREFVTLEWDEISEGNRVEYQAKARAVLAALAPAGSPEAEDVECPDCFGAGFTDPDAASTGGDDG